LEEGNEDRQVWVHRIAAGELFDDDRGHVRRSYDMSLLPEIAASPVICRALDKAEQWNTYVLYELAEIGLDDAARSGSLTRDDIEAVRQNVGEALETLHAAGFVHCDVQTSNVLRVGGAWKRGDLGGCVRIDDPIDTLPRDRRFVPPDIEFGLPAQPSLDWYGLDAILDDIRPRD